MDTKEWIENKKTSEVKETQGKEMNGGDMTIDDNDMTIDDVHDTLDCMGMERDSPGKVVW